MKVVNKINGINHLKFSKISFYLKPETFLSLPDFKGTTLRGGFGYAFKKIVCFSNVRKDCESCFLSDKCPYSLIFEGNLKNRGKWKGLKQVPKPFIIEPPLSHKGVYSGSETFKFNLILIGQAVNYFPYFFLAFSHLGEFGIGKGRKKFTIEKVEQIYPVEKTIYENGNDYIEKPLSTPLNFTEPVGVENIIFDFLTPVKIKHNGKYLSVIEFHQFFRNLLRRISLLSFFWCNSEIGFDWKNLIEESKKVRISRCNLRWIDFYRYSTRQHQSMKIGGVVGKIEYTGDLDKFLPFIELGKYIHIGKNTTFGLGQYTYTYSPTCSKEKTGVF